MDTEIHFEMPRNVEDSPEFWLGQVAAVVSLERTNKLTNVQAFNGIRDIMKRSVVAVRKDP